jgi:hypothetical protein
LQPKFCGGVPAAYFRTTRANSADAWRLDIRILCLRGHVGDRYILWYITKVAK